MENYSGKPYRAAVIAALSGHKPARILDVACGDGWLKAALPFSAEVDGIDFYAQQPEGYRHFHQADLVGELPAGLGVYDAIVCCEAIAYLENPGALLRNLHDRLAPGGQIIVSSPNPTYAGARLYFLRRGYSPGFAHFVMNRHRQAHMPWLPLAWPQFWLLFGLAGFCRITLEEVAEPKPKHAWERLIGWPAQRYARRCALRADHPEARSFWNQAASPQAIYGRRLVISAYRPAEQAGS